VLGAASQTQAELIFGNIQLSGYVTEPAELAQHYINSTTILLLAWACSLEGLDLEFK
jgi:hypothetical protein